MELLWFHRRFLRKSNLRIGINILIRLNTRSGRFYVDSPRFVYDGLYAIFGVGLSFIFHLIHWLFPSLRFASRPRTGREYGMRGEDHQGIPCDESELEVLCGRRGLLPGGSFVCQSSIRYVEKPPFAWGPTLRNRLITTTFRPSLFLSAPAIAPLTVFEFQPVASEICSMVAPAGRLSMAITWACLLFALGVLVVGGVDLRDVLVEAAPSLYATDSACKRRCTSSMW